MHPIELQKHTSSMNLALKTCMHHMLSRPTNITKGKTTYGSTSSSVVSCLEETKPCNKNLTPKADGFPEAKRAVKLVISDLDKEK